MADSLKNLTAAASALHPYYPFHAEIADYAANEWSVPALLGVFFSACAALFTATYYVARAMGPSSKNGLQLTKGELLTTMWFVLSGCIHIFEGFYALHFRSMGSSQHPIGQMWKEYAFSDSRYLTQDSFVLCMESITAVFWGPGCLLAAYLTIRRSPSRYGLRTIVSVGQFYGDVLYYMTCAFDHLVEGISYWRPEAFYFWFYFVLMNAFWIVIPGYLIYESCVVTAKAVGAMQAVDRAKKAT
ncbi:3-beta-hydroxysteroid-delta(8),delta(7)-isomerase [Acrodontium crateriforme]|uniref:3-beta-hydroxysteroid-delta(8), delta(7)-isomerase n=1 Tax=Acrodontium crateriforme TaxID=150365 RepID=A0AAQ3M8W4_9PEZI|nr:3-beta-hydroxysteroid-delta(8),delta(7)-isomerase [Acrodontium crateriforme]